MSESGIFKAAVQLPPELRGAYLDSACGANPELRREVESLLRVHDASGSFLREPPTGPPAFEPIPEGPGTRIGPYKLLQQIGEGGMGVVYMAEQEQPVRRKVALKIIKPGMDSKQVIARFEAERQALAMMDHQNIAKVLDAGTTDSGRPYFVMELVHGVPLTRYCDENKLTPRQRLELFVPICHAIQHAHQKGIIHRDIKPSNVLVTMYDDKPVPKVIDFGVAKAVEQRLTEKTLFTQYGALVGTFEYMSPEQAEMNAFGVDTRSDIYALGVLLYELLTGTTPLERARLREAALCEIVRLIKEEEAPRPSTRLSTSGAELTTISQQRGTEPAKLARLVKGELDWIVMRCLEKDRTRRYETANSLARDVQRYLAGDAVEACPPSLGYRLRKFCDRNKVAIVIAFAFFVMMKTTTFISLWQVRRATLAEIFAKRDRDEAEAARSRAEQERDRATRAEKEAKEQAASASAVNDFLQKDLLGQAVLSNQPGGEQARDPEVKVRTLLDRAAKTLEGRFSEQPLTEAALRLTIGDAYGALGQLTEAQPHLERAVRLFSASVGPEHYSTLHCKTRLALLSASRGQYGEAERLLQQVLQTHTAKDGAGHPDTLHTVRHLANVASTQGNHDQAEKLIEEARRGYTALGWEANHPELVNCKWLLAAVSLHRGELERAEALFQEVLKTRLLKLGADHPETLYTKMALATVFEAQRKLDHAEPLFKEVMQAFTTTLEENHPMLLNTTHNLAALYYRQGKYDRAEPLFRRAAEGYRRKLGLGHPLTYGAIRSWITSCERVGRLGQTEPLIRESLAFRKQEVGTDSQEYAGQLAVLGLVLLAQNKFAEAEAVLRDCLTIAERLQSELGVPSFFQCLLGAALLGQKKFAEAEPYLRKGYEGLKTQENQIPPEQQFRLTEALERLVHCYDAWGKPDEAAKWRKELETRKEADRKQ